MCDGKQIFLFVSVDQKYHHAIRLAVVSYHLFEAEDMLQKHIEKFPNLPAFDFWKLTYIYECVGEDIFPLPI